MYECYLRDMDCFKSCKALLNKMYYNTNIPTKTIISNQYSSIKTAKERRCNQVLQDFSSDESVIIGIQNEPKFINIILNSRKQKAPLAYIFVESDYKYVTCIIKNPDGFPLVVLRLPINKKVAYAKNTDNCYEFPIADIVNKDTKFNKSYSYSMVFKHNKQSIQFIFSIYNGTNEPNNVIIDDIKVGNMTIVDSIFKTDLTIIPTLISNNMSMEDTAGLLTFNNMNILILAEVIPSNVITFMNRLYCRSKNYFKLVDNQLYYVAEVNKKHNNAYVCSNKDSIYWNIIDDSAKMFEISQFEPLFKINYNKTISTTDRIYYVFATFLDNYMFVKIITSLDVNDDKNIGTFISTFSSEYQIIEAYLCSKC